MGMPFWHLVRPDDMQCVSRLDRKVEGAAPAYESRVQRKDGSQRWIEFRTVPIEYDGQRAVLGNIVDITERKELEIELIESNRELDAINRMMVQGVQPDCDFEKDIAGALADLASGVEGGEIGGVFLMESGGLVLRSLFGPVETLIGFIEGKDAKVLLAGPKVYEMEEGSDYIWATVPLTFDGLRGTIVVASTSSDGDRCLAFLQRAAPHIGRIINASGVKGALGQTTLRRAGANQGKLKLPSEQLKLLPDVVKSLQSCNVTGDHCCYKDPAENWQSSYGIRVSGISKSCEKDHGESICPAHHSAVVSDPAATPGLEFLYSWSKKRRSLPAGPPATVHSLQILFRLGKTYLHIGLWRDPENRPLD